MAKKKTTKKKVAGKKAVKKKPAKKSTKKKVTRKKAVKKKTANTKSASGSKTANTRTSSPIEEFKKPVTRRWPELKIKHKIKIPDALLNREGFETGFPDSAGTYIFWYGTNDEYLGWSLKENRTHTKLVWAIKNGKIETEEQLFSGTGRTASWAVYALAEKEYTTITLLEPIRHQVQRETYRNPQLLFMEERKVLDSLFEDSSSYERHLLKLLKTFHSYLNDEIKYKDFIESTGDKYYSEPDSRMNLESFLETADPQKHIIVSEFEAEFDKKTEAIRKTERNMKKELAKWALSKCLDQLEN